jgi:deoxyribonuclease V
MFEISQPEKAKFEREQKKFSKQVSIKDSIDFSKIERIGACRTSSFKNKIISGIIIFNKNMEILEQDYSIEVAQIPYEPAFRAFRELPVMMSVFDKIEEKPEIMLVDGEGIAHPRLFGLASHFSLVTSIPTIGVSNHLLCGEINGEDIIFNGKNVGKVVSLKKGSNPLYVSPGNLISIETAEKIVKRLIILPHKLPEPLHEANKYMKKIMEEVLKVEQ